MQAGGSGIWQTLRLSEYLPGYLSYSLNSLKGVIWGIVFGTITVFIKGDTRSLAYSSCGILCASEAQDYFCD